MDLDEYLRTLKIDLSELTYPVKEVITLLNRDVAELSESIKNRDYECMLFEAINVGEMCSALSPILRFDYWHILCGVGLNERIERMFHPRGGQ